MDKKYFLNQFQFMNRSNFKLTLGKYKFESLTGIERILDQIDHLDDREALRESFFRVFIDNKSKRFEKLYLDEKGNLDFDIVVELVEESHLVSLVKLKMV